MSISNPPTSATSTRTQSRRVRATVGIAAVGVFIVYLPINGVAGALTTIAGSTGASTSELQWVTDAYVIPMAAAVLSAGVFGDIYGRRRVFSLGLVLTALGATIAGSSSLLATAALPLLWVGQAVSGLGAGLVLPTTLALIAHAVTDPRARGRAIGLWATGTVGGLAVGPLLSGVILEVANWGWVFAPVVVLAAVMLVFARRRLPESSAPEGRKLDWPGQISASVGIAALIFGVVEGGAQGWSSAAALFGLTIGVVAMAVFVIAEARSSAPLMDLGLFKSASFSAATFSAVVALFSIVGVMFILSLYLGSTQQLTALEIGLRLVFVPGVALLVNPFVGRLMGRVRPELVLIVGLAVACVGTAFIAQIDESTTFIDLAWRLALFGVSNALMLTSLTVVAVNSAPTRQAGMASATSTALRQFGGALGPAILGAIYLSRLAAGDSASAGLGSALLTASVCLGVASVGCVLAVTRPALQSRRRTSTIHGG